MPPTNDAPATDDAAAVTPDEDTTQTTGATDEPAEAPTSEAPAAEGEGVKKPDDEATDAAETPAA